MEHVLRRQRIQEVAERFKVPHEVVVEWDREYRVTDGNEQVGFFLPMRDPSDNPIIIEYEIGIPDGTEIEMLKIT